MPKPGNDSVDEVDSTAYFPLDGKNFVNSTTNLFTKNFFIFKQRTTIQRSKNSSDANNVLQFGTRK